jgi:SAM-dependent methyltransferase
MAGELMRTPFQGVWTVVRFNWHLHAIGLLAAAAPLAASCYLTEMPRMPALVAAAGILLSLLLSLAATWIAYDASGLYRFRWLAPLLAGTGRGANLHAGFDETSRLLKSSFPSIRWNVFDFYDPQSHTEISIRRARQAHPPEPETVSISTDAIPLPDGSLDTALLFLAAHEIRDPAERVRFFRELRRTLAPGGRVIVTEHLRDLPNLLAYSVGAWHFHPRHEWTATFLAAGFAIEREFHNNPFITTFVLSADANAA